jgi:hypothetical protein
MVASMKLYGDSGAADVLSVESEFMVCSAVADALGLFAEDITVTGVSWYSSARRVLAWRYVFFSIRLEALIAVNLTRPESVEAALTRSAATGELASRLASTEALANDLGVAVAVLRSTRPVIGAVTLMGAASPSRGIAPGPAYFTRYDSAVIGPVFGVIGGVIAIALALWLRACVKRVAHERAIALENKRAFRPVVPSPSSPSGKRVGELRGGSPVYPDEINANSPGASTATTALGASPLSASSPTADEFIEPSMTPCMPGIGSPNTCIQQLSPATAVACWARDALPEEVTATALTSTPKRDGSKADEAVVSPSATRLLCAPSPKCLSPATKPLFKGQSSSPQRSIIDVTTPGVRSEADIPSSIKFIRR